VVFLPLSLTLVYFSTILFVPGSTLTTFFKLRLVNDETICVSSSFLSKSNCETSAPFNALVSSAFGSDCVTGDGDDEGGGWPVWGLHDATKASATDAVNNGNTNLNLL
jgi:hypothetical protein